MRTSIRRIREAVRFLCLLFGLRNFGFLVGLLLPDTLCLRPQTGSRLPATPASSHDRLLAAGKRLFAHKGYENSSTVAIAREAGTSESQLMKHFGSKQGLLTAILDRAWARIIDRVRSLDRSSPAESRLFGALEAMIIVLQNDSELKELMTLEAYRVRKESRDVLMSRGYRQYCDILSGILVEMRRERRPRVRREPRRRAFGSIWMTEGLLRDQVVASRCDFSAQYAFDDIRNLLQKLLPVFRSEAVPLNAAVR